MNKKIKEELVNIFTSAIENALDEIDFDVRCLDWLSYNPDYFIEKRCDV